MHKIKEINSTAAEFGLVRTLTNYSFNIDSDLYSGITDNLRKSTRYEQLNIAAIPRITTVLYCAIKHRVNENICFVNPSSITAGKKKKNPTVECIVVSASDNTDKVVDYVYLSKNIFAKFVKRKRSKNKISYTLLKKNQNVNSVTKYETKYSVKTITRTNHELKINMRSKYYITEEKIELEGRVMLPNSVTFVLDDRVRIILYENKKTTVILVKSDSADLNGLLVSTDIVLNQISMAYNKNNIAYTNLSPYFDFMYKTNRECVVLPTQTLGIRIISKNKLILHNINTKQKLVDAITHITYLESVLWPNLEKDIIKIDNPLKCPMDEIIHIINQIWDHP